MLTLVLVHPTAVNFIGILVPISWAVSSCALYAIAGKHTAKSFGAYKQLEAITSAAGATASNQSTALLQIISTEQSGR